MRKIIHLDMDCFYAAVEVKMRPDLKGKTTDEELMFTGPISIS